MIRNHIKSILDRVMVKLEEIRGSAADVGVDSDGVLGDQERGLLGCAVDCTSETLTMIGDRTQ